MSEVSKSLLAASGVMLAAGVVAAGTLIRDRVDGIALRAEPHEVHSLVASRDDSEIPEGDYYYNLSKLVEREYVEPVNDEQKLASGSVRGMIGSLGDPKSLYMDPKEFRTYLNERQGKYEGVGADFILAVPGPSGKEVQAGLQPTDADPEIAMEAPRIPKLTVVALTPGGPADRAGVKVGDTVYSVDAHWVVSGDPIRDYRIAERKFLKKEIDAAKLNSVRKEIHAKEERALLPLRALDRLTQGSSGDIKVVWERAGQKRETPLVKAPSKMAPFQASGNKILLPLVDGAAQHLKDSLKGKSDVTIDLRGNVLGDLGTMRQCLALLAPAGEYGRVYSTHAPRGVPIDVKKGNAHPVPITLLVDRSTSGAAEILALALSSRHLAKLSGSEMSGDRAIEQIVELPDGSGYTLQTGVYRTTSPSTVQANAKKGRA